MYAINPEAGYFGGPGTNITRTPTAWRSLDKDVIFTNVALTDDGDVWWEGMDDTASAARSPDRLAGQGLDAPDRQKPTGAKAAPPTPASPWPPPTTRAGPGLGRPGRRADDPFGGRRSTTVPLVTGPRPTGRRVHGRHRLVETTAAATGAQGVVRRDPFAMLPFCGYNMSDYFQHWLNMEGQIAATDACPRCSAPTGSARNADGKFIVWPGFGDNMRVLKRMIDRIEGQAQGRPGKPCSAWPQYADGSTGRVWTRAPSSSPR